MRYKIGFFLMATVAGFAQRQHPQSSLPVFFIPNAGQAEADVRFLVDTPGLMAGFGQAGALFRVGRTTLRVSFGGANPEVVMEGEEQLGGRANFLIGNQVQGWKTNLPVYQKILYRNLYPGIDLRYGGTGDRIKSEFLVEAGADPKLIRLEYSERVSIEANGDLLMRGEGAEMREEAPVIYQVIGGRRVGVDGRYVLPDAHTVKFEVDAYDHSKALIIDPTLSYGTYFGGSGMSAVAGMAVDPAGDLYVTGWTEAANFPIVGSVQPANGGGVDAFVAKLNAAGTTLLYATYIGGKSDDRGAGIAVDGTGEAYVAGSTESTNFPLASPYKSTLGGGRDAFVLKLNAAGNTLLFSTYLGGTNNEMGNALAVDGSGDAYVAGDTWSANFPVLGAAQTTFGGNQDAFISKFSAAGKLVYSTFLGGSGAEHAGGIALDASNNAYIAGGTSSTNFPVVQPIQAVNGGYEDAFLTKLNAAGSQFLYSTYLGGDGGGTGGPEQANGVAVDAGGNAYLAGTTNSTNFPVTTGAFQTQFRALQDGFVAKVNAAGSALVYSTLLGGSTYNWANGVAVNSSGSAYIAGYTASPDFPVANPIQATLNNLYDAFVTVVNPTGTALTFSTYFGGSGSDEANAIAIDALGNMYLGGQTGSNDLPVLNPIQSSNTGGSMGWLAKFASGSRRQTDFTGDGMSDVAVYRPSTGQWFVMPSNNPNNWYAANWGIAGDIPVTADYDGDGKLDLAVYRPSTGVWYIQPSSNPNGAYTVAWGLNGDVPVVGDYDGDGKADVAIWRPSNGGWYIIPSSNLNAAYAVAWGLASDVPVIGDFDGDGKTDLAVWRASNGGWYILPSSNPGAPYGVGWGQAGDTPVIGDFDGDGKTDLAVWRASNGGWYVVPSGNPSAAWAVACGVAGDIPVAQDFDGDRKTDLAVFRPSSATWYIIPSGSPANMRVQQWGEAGDKPVFNGWEWTH